MMDTYNQGLSILDFVPNLGFLIGAIYLVRWVTLFKRRDLVIIMVVGTGLVFLGGTLKAVWKLLYTLSIGDFVVLSEAQFILLAPGFFLMLLSVIRAFKEYKNKQNTVLALAPWKIPLMAIMVISSLGVHGILSYDAFRRKAHLAGVLYIVAIICMLSMSGMASGNQTIARQWMEEMINSFGQISFAVGSYLLYKNYQKALDVV